LLGRGQGGKVDQMNLGLPVQAPYL
jgi:hypothetical protein